MMKKSDCLTWLLALVVFGMIPSDLLARTFTDEQGRKILANIVKVLEDKVELKMEKNGKTYQVPLTRLSQADRDFIKEWQDAQEKEKAATDPVEDKEPKVNKVVRQGSSSSMMAEYGLKENFDAEWPDRINSGFDVEINVFKEDASTKEFIYHSPNYEFISDVRLSKNVVNKFAALFEATREYCRELPISTIKAHVPGEKFRNKILLFETKETYIKNGGPPMSAGVFMSRGGNGIVMAPLSGLGVKKVGSGYMFDYKGSNKTLPHEITHQLTDREYYQAGARGWFSEGLAEYVANTPYRSGKYMVKTNLSSIKDYATGYGKDGRGGRALGEKISAPDLQTYMLQSYANFVGNANFNYGMGLLITYYYFHWDNDGDRSNMNAFLKALKEGKKGDEALNVLLNGRSWDEMEKQIMKAWRSRGVRITFK